MSKDKDLIKGPLTSSNIKGGSYIESNKYLENRIIHGPFISGDVGSKLSDYRRSEVTSQVESGIFTEGSQAFRANTLKGLIKTASASNNVLPIGSHIKKYAQVAASGTYKGGNDTVNQAPSIYSPLWNDSNLSLPRDKATINAWCRNFFALNGIVHNVINLHSTYPLSKLNIKCKNKQIENFFNEMIEEIDLMSICVQVAQEYWLLGEAVVYAELDPNKAKWSRLSIQNPDYILINRSPVPGEPILMLKPDEQLKQIIKSNRPSDIEKRNQLDPYIIDAVKRGGNIPLNNFNTSFLSRKIAPYESRGTGLPVSVFKQLMLFDMLRECHDEQTEVLTDSGFKFISELMQENKSLNIKPQDVNGIVLENNKVSSIYTLKNDFKAMQYNDGNFEYVKPEGAALSHYSGEMYRFNSRNYDALVTPNHKMYAKDKEWKLMNAKDLYGSNKYFRFNRNW